MKVYIVYTNMWSKTSISTRWYQLYWYFASIVLFFIQSTWILIDYMSLLKQSHSGWLKVYLVYFEHFQLSWYHTSGSIQLDIHEGHDQTISDDLLNLFFRWIISGTSILTFTFLQHSSSDFVYVKHNYH